MPARERVNLEQIKAALGKWQGNVQAAADELGMRRRSLYERIDSARIEVRGYRAGGQGPKLVTIQDETAGSPFPAAPRRPLRLRVQPEHAERLREARLEIIATFRVEVSEQNILDTFVSEAFDDWLRSKLESGPGR